MVEKKDIYMTEAYQKAASTDNITLKGDPIPAGRVVMITMMAVKDETTTGKTCRLGYVRGNTAYWLREEPASTNYHGIAETGTLYLTENEAPAAMVESPTSADEVKFFVRGIYL